MNIDVKILIDVIGYICTTFFRPPKPDCCVKEQTKCIESFLFLVKNSVMQVPLKSVGIKINLKKGVPVTLKVHGVSNAKVMGFNPKELIKCILMQSKLLWKTASAKNINVND